MKFIYIIGDEELLWFLDILFFYMYYRCDKLKVIFEYENIIILKGNMVFVICVLKYSC